jgi:hypothetical protein
MYAKSLFVFYPRRMVKHLFLGKRETTVYKLVIISERRPCTQGYGRHRTLG